MILNCFRPSQTVDVLLSPLSSKQWMSRYLRKPGNRLRKCKICEQRYIKVNAIHYEYRTKQQSAYSGSRAVPWIQMKGHWLDQAGFSIDTPVTVRVMDGCLVLTAEQQTAT